MSMQEDENELKNLDTSYHDLEGGLQEIDNHALDIACMATPWLISAGFVTIFSALFSKTWRLNILFRKGHIMRRVQVPPSDVILPFCILLTINFSVLISWTITSPLYWERQTTHNFDEYGRSVESYGLCNAESESHVYLYAALIIVVNISALIFANYQAYLARHLPTDFPSRLLAVLLWLACWKLLFWEPPCCF
jgi:gamma-aminobutyric acid type B receptor